MFFFLEPRSYILYHKLVILDFAVPDFFSGFPEQLLRGSRCLLQYGSDEGRVLDPR